MGCSTDACRPNRRANAIASAACPGRRRSSSRCRLVTGPSDLKVPQHRNQHAGPGYDPTAGRTSAGSGRRPAAVVATRPLPKGSAVPQHHRVKAHRFGCPDCFRMTASFRCTRPIPHSFSDSVVEGDGAHGIVNTIAEVALHAMPGAVRHAVLRLRSTSTDAWFWGAAAGQQTSVSQPSS